MEQDTLKFKTFRSKPELTEWYNNLITVVKIVSIDKDAANGEVVAWYLSRPQLVWQYSTKQSPDNWIDATNEDYEVGKDLAKFNWRQIEK